MPAQIDELRRHEALSNADGETNVILSALAWSRRDRRSEEVVVAILGMAALRSPGPIVDTHLAQAECPRGPSRCQNRGWAKAFCSAPSLWPSKPGQPLA